MNKTSPKCNEDGLALQNSEILSDPSKITPLTHQIMSRQPTINIGTIGHVAHGKSTCVHALSGIKTVRFKDELERNITIKLGYANAKIFECPNCPRPGRFHARQSDCPDNSPCPQCNSPMTLRRHFSFVDCPGHDILMATMLNGAAVMDGAMLLVAGNERCPQPQTSEHLAALEIMKLQHILILQNKIDLTEKHQAAQQYAEIRDFIKGTVADRSPIIPISAQLKYNIDYLCELLCTHIPVPVRDMSCAPMLTIIRSFDVNRPGCDVENLQGGVAGGTLLQGILRVGDDIEIRPGYITKDADDRLMCAPIYSRIVSLHSEQNRLEYAVPGGLIGVGTSIDPMVARSDRLVGKVLGLRGRLPDVYIEIEVNFHLLKRLLGVKDSGSRKTVKVKPLAEEEILLLSIGAMTTGGRVKRIRSDCAKIEVTNPVCTERNSKIAISRRIDKHWRLIGWGTIVCGKRVLMAEAGESNGMDS